MKSSNNWISLAGGNVNSVDSNNNVVRRKLTATSPAIHQLLRYLEAKNIPCVSCLLNFDDKYEYLSYIPGSAIFRP